MSRLTMQDVAEVMGVSVMTVSNAFNRPDQLSVDLRRRILRRAETMGYSAPSASARALRQGRANAYGVVFAEQLTHAFSDPYSVEWLAGFTEAMQSRRSSIVLLSVPATPDADLSVIRNVAVDGIAGMCASHPAMDLGRQQRLPVVAGDPGGGDFVAIDETAAAAELAAHVTSLGHRSVCVVIPAVFAQPQAPAALTVAEFEHAVATADGADVLAQWHRLQGLLAGLKQCDVTILVIHRLDRQLARDAAGLVLDRRHRPTAVIALGDSAALGILDALGARGLIAGQDLSVGGFDDLPEAAAAGLTTVHQPIREKGRLAAELLLDPDRRPRQVVVPHRLVVRSSTGPATEPDRRK